MTVEYDNVKREKAIRNVTLLGSIVNFLLLVFKTLAGILGHSAAMLADAVHSMSDFVSDVVVLTFVRVASRPNDSDHQYGHGKFETLATAIIGILLFGVGVGIFWDGAVKIWHFINGEELEQPGYIALWAALISIVVKEILYQVTARVSRKYDSPVVQANAWHHRSDALSSIGATLGIGGAILFGVKGRVLDPIAAVIVSIFIVRVAVKLTVPCINELLEKSLPKETEQRILEAIKSVPEVTAPHNLRTRRIGPYAAVEVHVRMDGQMTVARSHEITRLLEQRIRDVVGQNSYVNIHVEPIK